MPAAWPEGVHREARVLVETTPISGSADRRFEPPFCAHAGARNSDSVKAIDGSRRPSASRLCLQRSFDVATPTMTAVNADRPQGLPTRN
jgi:hypothetical protein